jgi:hypothetical protein
MVKKGQIEAMGLVIILVLLVLLGLFFLKYSGKEEVDSDRFLTIRANNFLNSLRQVSIGVNSFEDLALECCAGGNCGNVGPRVSANGDGYLDEDFYFELKCADESTPVVKSTNCASTVASGHVVLVSGDEMFVRLCRDF